MKLRELNSLGLTWINLLIWIPAESLGAGIAC